MFKFVFRFPGSSGTSTISRNLRATSPGGEESEEALIRAYDVPGAGADEILAFDDDDDDECEAGWDDREDSDTGVEGLVSESVGDAQVASRENFEEYKTQIRVQETQRAEKNRRAGGVKTQNAMVRAWEVSSCCSVYSISM